MEAVSSPASFCPPSRFPGVLDENLLHVFVSWPFPSRPPSERNELSHLDGTKTHKRWLPRARFHTVSLLKIRLVKQIVLFAGKRRGPAFYFSGVTQASKTQAASCLRTPQARTCPKTAEHQSANQANMESSEWTPPCVAHTQHLAAVSNQTQANQTDAQGCQWSAALGCRVFHFLQASSARKPNDMQRC